MATPSVPSTPGTTTSSIDDAMNAGIASMEQTMAKQIEFTSKANPIKAAESMAKGSRMG